MSDYFWFRQYNFLSKQFEINHLCSLLFDITFDTFDNLTMTLLMFNILWKNFLLATSEFCTGNVYLLVLSITKSQTLQKIHQMALEHALDSVADLNQPTHWQTSAEYHPKTPIFENSLKTYKKTTFQWIFFVKLSWHCRLNFFCYKYTTIKSLSKYNIQKMDF